MSQSYFINLRYLGRFWLLCRYKFKIRQAYSLPKLRKFFDSFDYEIALFYDRVYL